MRIERALPDRGSCHGWRGGHSPFSRSTTGWLRAVDLSLSGTGLSHRDVTGLLQRLLPQTVAVHSKFLCRLLAGRLLPETVPVRAVLHGQLPVRLLLP